MEAMQALALHDCVWMHHGVHVDTGAAPWSGLTPVLSAGRKPLVPPRLMISSCEAVLTESSAWCYLSLTSLCWTVVPWHCPAHHHVWCRWKAYRGLGQIISVALLEVRSMYGGLKPPLMVTFLTRSCSGWLLKIKNCVKMASFSPWVLQLPLLPTPQASTSCFCRLLMLLYTLLALGSPRPFQDPDE